MRILHTSDWHLGRTFHGRSLDDAHALFADHLVETVRSEGVDAVLVSGDVYDRAVPPTDSVRLLDETLRRLCEVCRVVLTPGNHDSARRLGFASRLLDERLVIQARADGVDRAVLLPDADGATGALVYALPYLDPDAARVTLPPLLDERLGEHHSGSRGEEGTADGQAHPDDGDRQDGERRDGEDASPPATRLARSHEAVVSGALRLVAADLASRRHGASTRVPALVMAHAFVAPGSAGSPSGSDPDGMDGASGPLVSESERDIRVGGVDLVPSEVFVSLGGSPVAGRSGGLDYVALGHLHRPQAVGLPASVRERVQDHVLPVLRYSGSPLAFSFSEAPWPKSSVLLEVASDGVSRTELVGAPVPHRVATVRDDLDTLLSPRYDDMACAWLRVELTGLLPSGAVARLRQRFPHMLAFSRVAPQQPGGHRVVVSREADPLRVGDAFLEAAGGRPPDAAESAVLREAYEAVRAAERSR